jgi:hypothetical protein
MKASAWVEKARLERHEAGRRQYRPNGGEFVINHERGLVGEALDETLDCLNYLDRVKSQRAREAAMLVQEAAELLAMEAGYGD